MTDEEYEKNGMANQSINENVANRPRIVCHVNCIKIDNE